MIAAAGHGSLAWSRTIHQDNVALKMLKPRAASCRSEYHPTTRAARCSKFNAGVFGARLDRWAKYNKTAELEMWMHLQTRYLVYEGGSNPPMLLAFLDVTEPMDGAWNTVGISHNADKYKGTSDPRLKRAKILHFTGEHKPWLPGGFYRELWLPYALGYACDTKALETCTCTDRFGKTVATRSEMEERKRRKKQKTKAQQQDASAKATTRR